MNKAEQTFATKLKNHLLKTKPEQSMAIEVKVVKGKTFNFNMLRKGQWATLLKLHEGIPVAYKISDSSMGSKLVDLLYLHPDGINVLPMVAVKFADSKKMYLVDFEAIKNIKEAGQNSVREVYLNRWVIKM